jgi:phage-related protein
MLRTALLASLLLMAPLAAAQHGPAPGYGSAIAYAADYAKEKASNATADPTGFVAREATAEAVQNETENALYVVCWEAWDATGQQAMVCDPYFTPPGTEDAIPEATNSTADDLNATVGDAQDLLNTTAAAAQNITEDPTSAPSEIDRVVDAAFGFLRDLVGGLGLGLEWVVDLLAGVVGGIATAVQDALGKLGIAGAATALGLADGLGSVGKQVTDLLGSLGSGFALAMRGTGTGISSAVSAVGAGISSAAGGVGDLLSRVGTGLRDGTVSVRDGVGSGLSSAGRAVQDAARSVGDGVSGAARGVADWVGSLFGGSSASGPAPGPGQKLPSVPDKANGVVDKVRDLVPV